MFTHRKIYKEAIVGIDNADQVLRNFFYDWVSGGLDQALEELEESDIKVIEHEHHDIAKSLKALKSEKNKLEKIMKKYV